MAKAPKTEPVAQAFPFRREHIKSITGDPDVPAGRSLLSVCEICAAIPKYMPSRQRSIGSERPDTEELKKLEEYVWIKEGLKILRCPFCGTLYREAIRNDILAGPREVNYSLTRITRSEAFELLLGLEARGLIKRAGVWVVAW